MILNEGELRPVVLPSRTLNIPMMSSLALSKNNHSCVSNESLVTTERDINKAAYGIETGSTILLFSHGH